MEKHDLTRRRLVALGAGAVALGTTQAWVRPLGALAEGASARPVGFALQLDADDLGGGGEARAASGQRTSRVLGASRRFDLVGLRWADRPPVEAQVRARRRGGRWSGWLTLHAGGDHAPDGEVRRATEPAWFGGADELQLRLPAGAAPPRVQFVASRAAAPRGDIRGRAAAAPAPGGGPPIVLRAGWGGDGVPPKEDPSYGQVQMAFVHHTVNANSYDPSDSPAIVLAIAKFHMDANDWNDIGYNFLVDRYGQIFEGRAGGLERAVIGAQAQGWNAQSTGIAVLGTHGSSPATRATIAALGELIGWKLARHGVPTEGEVSVVSAGGATNRFTEDRAVTFARINGHRDANATECPGGALYRQLPEVRALAARAARGVAVASPAQPSAVTARAATRRVRAKGIGVLLRGTVDGDAPVRVAVSRQVDGRYRWVRSTGARRAADGTWSARVRLPTPGLYRLTAVSGDARAEPEYVRSVRSR
ncbi:MAG: N-acetylmuramoyl-L-alanine amidase [Solirubrobacteraceae bacterium]